MSSDVGPNPIAADRPRRRLDGFAAWMRRTLTRSPGQDEEALNALTHGVSLLASLAGAVIVLVAVFSRGDAVQAWSCVFYTITLVGAYSASTLSHLFTRPRLRDFFRGADQAIIFLFIAGSYTPMAMTWLRSGPWWWLHGAVWAVALAGFCSKALCSHNVQLGTVTTWLYVLAGCMPVLATWQLFHIMPTGLLISLYVGGACYMLGLIFFHYDYRVRYCHTAWHVMVIAGSICHYMGIWMYCTGPVLK